jgi:hypothetical protein
MTVQKAPPLNITMLRNKPPRHETSGDALKPHPNHGNKNLETLIDNIIQ